MHIMGFSFAFCFSGWFAVHENLKKLLKELEKWRVFKSF
jgi:hypothetical protein